MSLQGCISKSNEVEEAKEEEEEDEEEDGFTTGTEVSPHRSPPPNGDKRETNTVIQYCVPLRRDQMFTPHL